MWEKISKEMQLPWRAAEAMHWQIGEIEMAQRANVPVFHLAGQQATGGQAGAGSEGRPSTSPSSGAPLPPGMAYSHNHSLPQVPQALSHPVSPAQTRLRRSSDEISPSGGGHQLRRLRADSARSVPTSSTLSRAPLPPLVDVNGHHHPPARYTLPPVVTGDAGRR